MWHKEFTDRLQAWAELRAMAHTMELEELLQTINTWWYQAPWRGYYLHWDDRANWPDPWQLLSDNIYCDLARGLGILYTLSLIEHKDLISAELVLTEDDRNLVLVNQEKYVLNWEPIVMVNTPLLVHNVIHRFSNPSS